MAWIENNLSHFALPQGPIDEALLRAMKPIGELVLVAEKVAAHRPHLSARCWALLHWAWEQFERGDLILKLLTARPDLIVLSTIQASFAASQLINERLTRWTRYLCETSACRGIEFPRWRALDVLHARAALGAGVHSEITFENTWLAQLPEPWMITDDIAYGITHEVFYVTDYGRRKDAVPVDIKRYLDTWIPAWLHIYRSLSNYDLHAELLMVAAYTGARDVYDYEVPHLMSWQASDGRFPGPTGSAAALIDDSMPRGRQTFLRDYHTTLVALLALATYPQDGSD